MNNVCSNCNMQLNHLTNTHWLQNLFLLFIWNILWQSLIWLSLLIKCGKYSFIYKKKVTTDTKLKRSTRLETKLEGRKKKQLACKAFVTFQHTHSLLSVKTVQWQPFLSGKTNEHLIHSELTNTMSQISTLNQYLWSRWEKTMETTFTERAPWAQMTGSPQLSHNFSQIRQ